MKKFWRLFLLGIFCVAVVLAVTGCGRAATQSLNLSDLATRQYNNPDNGATITIPADWKVVSEDENCTVFQNQDSSISFVLKWELGGMSYFSKEELAGLAEKVCQSTINDSELYKSLELNNFDVAVKAVCTGTVKDKSGKAINAVCDTAIIQYFNDVRYYLVATTDAGTYAEYETVFTQIANSFTDSLTEDEAYEKINEQTAAAADNTTGSGGTGDSNSK